MRKELNRSFTVAAMLFLAVTSTVEAQEVAGRATVVDGDTIEIRGQRIRFDGVDAPEARQRCEDANGKAYRCGKVSADALDAFLAKSRPTTCQINGKSWDRLVGTCRRADGADVSRWMVQQGHAIDWPKYSHGKYASDQKKAQASGSGLWAGRFEWPCVVRGAKCE